MKRDGDENDEMELNIFRGDGPPNSRPACPWACRGVGVPWAWKVEREKKKKKKSFPHLIIRARFYSWRGENSFSMAWRFYTQMLKKYPLRTQMASSCVIWGCGDIVAQHLEKSVGNDSSTSMELKLSADTGDKTKDVSSKMGASNEWDWRRTAQQTTFATCLWAPAGNWWYQYLDRKVLNFAKEGSTKFLACKLGAEVRSTVNVKVFPCVTRVKQYLNKLCIVICPIMTVGSNHASSSIGYFLHISWVRPTKEPGDPRESFSYPRLARDTFISLLTGLTIYKG